MPRLAERMALDQHAGRSFCYSEIGRLGREGAPSLNLEYPRLEFS
jgi:hypothetical protein